MVQLWSITYNDQWKCRFSREMSSFFILHDWMKIKYLSTEFVLLHANVKVLIHHAWPWKWITFHGYLKREILWFCFHPQKNYRKFAQKVSSPRLHKHILWRQNHDAKAKIACIVAEITHVEAVIACVAAKSGIWGGKNLLVKKGSVWSSEKIRDPCPLP